MKKPDGWTSEQKALIDWFLAEKKLPTGPYALRQGTTVINQDLFYERLRDDIKSGPGTPRQNTGALFDDLRCLKEICENQFWP